MRALILVVIGLALTACRDDAPETPPSYQSCVEAQAAGDVPLKRGRDAGYRRALDRDGDGWACDDE